MALVIFDHAPPPVPCEDCCPSYQKSFRWDPLISASIWIVRTFLTRLLTFSLAVLFQGTYPEIPSGGSSSLFYFHTVNTTQ